ncbi:MAG: Hpt domain-containing protein [Bacteroidota bacterium]|nr:Hpt domain-containing protein [Bacteroidota bacterium]
MSGNEPLVYDLSIVKEASDDIEYLKEITGYFINNAGEMLKVLEKAFSESDYESAQNAAHKLSSNFYMFGLNEGAAALSKIDLSLKNKENYKEIPSLIMLAQKQGEEAIRQLRRDFHE